MIVLQKIEKKIFLTSFNKVNDFVHTLSHMLKTDLDILQINIKMFASHQNIVSKHKQEGLVHGQLAYESKF